MKLKVLEDFNNLLSEIRFISTKEGESSNIIFGLENEELDKVLLTASFIEEFSINTQEILDLLDNLLKKGYDSKIVLLMAFHAGVRRSLKNYNG